MNPLEALLTDIHACRECESCLPLGPRPIVAAHEQSRVLIIGQAPGLRAHESGVPWDDASGDRLRDWMGITREDFYDPTKLALVPMGFCYPGTGDSGDLPPRKECSELWHEHLLAHLDEVKLTLVVGRHAQRYRLGRRTKPTLTETVKAWKEFTPSTIPLPHPSPRNNRWLARNPWFVSDVLPYLKLRIARLM